MAGETGYSSHEMASAAVMNEVLDFFDKWVSKRPPKDHLFE